MSNIIKRYSKRILFLVFSLSGIASLVAAKFLFGGSITNLSKLGEQLKDTDKDSHLFIDGARADTPAPPPSDSCSDSCSDGDSDSCSDGDAGDGCGCSDCSGDGADASGGDGGSI